MASQDWSAIRQAYEQGGFPSLAALARQWNVSAPALRYHVKQWRAELRPSAPAEKPAEGVAPREAWDHLLSSAREMARLINECPDTVEPKRLNELAGALEKIQRGLSGSREALEQDGVLALAQAILAAAEQRRA